MQDKRQVIRMKAKFIRKYSGTGYEKDFVFLDYEYKGHIYTIYQNYAKGNEPLSWQHRTAQDRIDKIIETENISNDNEQVQNIDRVFEELYKTWES